MNHAVAHAPRFRGAIGIHPAGQIAAVEQRNKAILISSERSAGCGHQEHQGKSFHAPMMSSPPAECTRETNRSRVCLKRARVLNSCWWDFLRLPFILPPTLLTPLLFERFTNSIACG